MFSPVCCNNFGLSCSRKSFNSVHSRYLHRSTGLKYLKKNIQDPVVQSIVSLTSSLVVKMFTVLVNTISN